MHAGALALLETLQADPRLARLLVLEHPDLAVAECALRVERALEELLEAARSEVMVGAQLLPQLDPLAELLTSAFVSSVRSPILTGRGEELAELAPALERFVVSPYLERAIARVDASTGAVCEEAQLRAEVVPVRATRAHLLVLSVLAPTPHLRNCEIAAAAGLSGSGEASQLLKRVSERALIERTPAGGRSRSWALTAYGRRVLALLAPGSPATRRPEPDRNVTRRPGTDPRPRPRVRQQTVGCGSRSPTRAQLCDERTIPSHPLNDRIPKTRRAGTGSTLLRHLRLAVPRGVRGPFGK